MNTIVAQPSAVPVIQALRSLGYNSKTAIADIIDNSFDAKATEINIQFKYNENDGTIKISDNGVGMTGEELHCAMQIGSQDPRAIRKPKELGRFGMGLKTASFSMGKRVCVLTKKNGIYSERCWDLDHVLDSNEWEMFTYIPEEVKRSIGEIDGESGTIVHIDKLDKFMGFGGKKPIKQSSFYSKVNRIQQHLEFIFHSFIEENPGILTINETPLQPWDPFFSEHMATLEGEEQEIKFDNYRMKVKYFILPHASKLNKQEYKTAGGNKGWYDQQGIYIYRENRLLYYGDWLGMFNKDSSSQLARIRVDIPNTADLDWQVDIKKSAISPPDHARKRLESISKLTRRISRDVFYFRAQNLGGKSSVKGSLNTWEQSNLDKGPQFILNRNHPMLLKLFEGLDQEAVKLLNIYLKFVQLGSPSNMMQTPKIEEEKIQEISDSDRNLIYQFTKTLINIGVVEDKESIVNALITQPAFDGINRVTLERIIEEMDL
ncbi:ATP-binding protein [Halobacillus sp. Cin3]|uniref:ATP-binding protein n=1 Tax=Halobacillus sp. Cin3 TaxID=2928441 RepID=UPI00248E5B2F|nr:ATP-binding protein [Halobacillus sp. Cin3]